MRENRGAGLAHHRVVAARVVPVLVRIEDLRDREALVFRGLEALLVIERIDGERLAGFGARDQVVEVAVVVGGPDLLDDHGITPKRSAMDNDSGFSVPLARV